MRLRQEPSTPLQHKKCFPNKINSTFLSLSEWSFDLNVNSVNQLKHFMATLRRNRKITHQPFPMMPTSVPSLCSHIAEQAVNHHEGHFVWLSCEKCISQCRHFLSYSFRPTWNPLQQLTCWFYKLWHSTGLWQLQDVIFTAECFEVVTRSCATSTKTALQLRLPGCAWVTNIAVGELDRFLWRRPSASAETADDWGSLPPSL